MFICDRCGLCCQNLNLNPLYDDLNDGSGTCKHYDRSTKLCKIYDDRPDKCNVEVMSKVFSCFLTYEEYLEMNIEACKKLKEGILNGEDDRKRCVR